MSAEEKEPERVLSVQLIAKVSEPLAILEFENTLAQSAQKLFGSTWSCKVETTTVYADDQQIVGLMEEEAHRAGNETTVEAGGDPS